jgi:two-component system sensor histidine kinase DesK
MTSRFRLIPDDRYLGWTPYLWLVYFPALFLSPVFNGAAAGAWVATGAGALAFLVLYFRAYWTSGREYLAITVAIAALGFALMPSNPGASVFITYAAAFAGPMRPRRVGLAMLAALAVLTAACGLLSLVVSPLWIIEIALILSIGLSNMHFDRVRETNRALTHAREEVEQLARVAERERIARDLHDVLGHTLTLITLKSALAARLAERDPAQAALEMRDVERVSREALQEVRAAVAGHRDVGLARELANAREMLGAAGVAVTYAASPMAISPTEEATLALAMREAVTNVVRHAQATSCRITLDTDGRRRILAIEDDGRGKRGPDGSGLAGMRERVRALGGQLVVDSGLLSGTRVQITLAGTSS